MAKKFSQEHEWVEYEDGVATVGITDYAQQSLGDIVYVELPEVGKKLTKDGDAAVVESVKAASDVYAPLDGVVVEANEELDDNPALVNEAPESDGWFFRMELSDESQLDELMDEAAYKDFVEGL
ncbi:glycine cleavage system H protein [Thalassospira sp. MBR-102]|jgi:glycine cleavage system H protein|uniref:Glycine cleavage system H protein n=4 Tax=Thalassospira TaxID=168934 RepID=A0A285TKE2_9PROT|nr:MULTISPECIES: glycine cleavage system protein GcvH [Thalassospira]AJD53612.1 glycine cleavage systemh protein [Thalassospira xiamenensis M-5 = DSM 17429]KEO59544.1 glycine cleavage system protein H [Thalassospira permensis NBRC 106175]MAB32794.1 glycine cleavage system protein H [Thalassospira sp.]MBA06009.1 glycine cleavage system protein H [Thalassospira sp.]MDM7974730.1 glycine cleavage system protein GcvH [Thalassospira xiamenensis]|tara:strand:+ start:572 stop:943 length:372 start_codon:yes stop_codon:yes gene_type:complete